MTHVLASLIALLFLFQGACVNAQGIEHVRCWKYEKFSFSDDQRIIVEDAYLSFLDNGEVWFHGEYDSNIEGKAFRNTFILVDSTDARVAVIVVEHPLDCGVGLKRIKASSYRKYSSNPVESISWKGWEVDDMTGCPD